MQHRTLFPAFKEKIKYYVFGNSVQAARSLWSPFRLHCVLLVYIVPFKILSGTFSLRFISLMFSSEKVLGGIRFRIPEEATVFPHP
jgi:hypothetical protein